MQHELLGRGRQTADSAWAIGVRQLPCRTNSAFVLQLDAQPSASSSVAVAFGAPAGESEEWTADRGHEHEAQVEEELRRRKTIRKHDPRQPCEQ